MGEGRSLAETPTWSVATVTTAMVFVCFLVERGIHRLGKWLHKTKRKAMLASLEKIREDLMLLGLISLMLSQTARWISEICVPSSLFSSRFYICSKDDFSVGGESGESHPLNQTDFASTVFGVHPHGCDEGYEPFVSFEGLEQLHRFLFILGITHVLYSFVTVVLSMIKIYSWRKWEKEAYPMSTEDLQVWNKLTTTTTSKLQLPIQQEEETSGESDSQCFMVQGNDSLEVQSETQLDSDDCVNSSNDYVDANALNEELSIVCEKLIEKYNVLKKKSLGLNNENKNLISRLNIVLQEKVEISNERDSLKSQLELALKENKILKSKNDCETILKKNETLSSKIDFVVKENDSLKNEIDFISKELEICLKKNEVLKNKIDTHVCHARIASHSLPIACSTSSLINNDIFILKKNIDCLGSTLSHCAMNHTRLESMFRKKQIPPLHAHHPRHTHASHDYHHHTMYAHVYTCTHCGRKGHLAKFYFDRIYVYNLANKFVWVREGTNPHGPKKIWVPKTTPIVFDVGVGSRMT